MKAYAIYEAELESLSIFNWLTGVAFSAGTAFLSFMLAVYVDIAKEPGSVTHPDVPNFVYWACTVLAVGFYLVSGISFWKRRSKLEQIKKDSKSFPIQAG